MKRLIDVSHIFVRFPLCNLVGQLVLFLTLRCLILVLTCLITPQYLSFLFLAMRSATLFTNRLHSLDMPPVVRNSVEVKVALLKVTPYCRKYLIVFGQLKF